ncbi:MAG: sulfate reduction electron transfer complex DsrMKJOP subunit DsrM [Bryobacteraceae bacterium]|nr:sulfate reduction electron transfer complex DsrMKJOP subunit DsrM [Bryobacteraceae bacterium]
MELTSLIAVAIPYAAIAIFLIGFSYRIVRWSLSPVPFRIPTVCGQQKSLPWIKAGYLESPWTRMGVVARMALEILLFRSLFRNTRAELRQGPKLSYLESKFLWLGALAFHWSFLVILLRHLRFFLEPVPAFVGAIEAADGFFQVSLPVLYLTDVVILVALGYLLARRIWNAQARYISLPSDYLALALLIGLAGTGVIMRYFTRVDVIAAKQFALGLATFSPVAPENLGVMFYAHLFTLSALIAYLPFSKLVHMGGVFLSPTRNLANDNRARRHVNPWNYPVKVHTYQEWEDEFREKIAAAGLPLERQ